MPWASLKCFRAAAKLSGVGAGIGKNSHKRLAARSGWRDERRLDVRIVRQFCACNRRLGAIVASTQRKPECDSIALSARSEKAPLKVTAGSSRLSLLAAFFAAIDGSGFPSSLAVSKALT